MQRLVFLLIAALLLSVALWSDACGRERPYDWRNHVGGEDHTWGGDENGDPVVQGTNESPGSVVGAIGVSPLDGFINNLLFEWLYRRAIEAKYSNRAIFPVTQLNSQTERGTTATPGTRGE
ncbi:MAG TPA: hypothetical protein VN285_05805 [Candidatus Deferrimicrobium sp.]|nr:hypothetical protein [Candidatus Deferrimicrobium sp.]